MNRGLMRVAALAMAGWMTAGMMGEAAVRTWTGLGTDNNWSTAGNWNGGVPGSTDTALFDGTTNKNAVVDAGFPGTVASLTLASGYTGTNTLNRSLTVTTTYAQTNGTLDASAADLTIGGTSYVSGDDFVLAGGVFTCPTNLLTLNGSYVGNLRCTGGTFNHNNGTVKFKYGGGNINFPGVTFNNMTVDTFSGYPVTFSAAVTNVVLGTLTHTNGCLSKGTFDLRGDLTVGSGALGGDGVILLQTAGDQTINGSAGATCSLTIAKPSGSVNVLGGVLGLGINSSLVSNFKLVSGTFNAPTGTFAFASGYGGAWSRAAGATFNHNNGTLRFTKSGALWVYATNTMFNNFILDTSNTIYLAKHSTNVVLGTCSFLSGTLLTDNPSVNDYSSGLDLRGDLTVGGTAQGGYATLAFLTTGDQTINCSTGFTCGIYVNKPSGAVSVVGGDLNMSSSSYAAYFTLAGGTFNSTSNKFYLNNAWGGTWQRSGGLFNHNQGTLVMSGSHPYLNAPDVTFYKMIVDVPNDTLYVTTGTTNTIVSTFVHSNGTLSAGTFVAQGNVVIGGTNCLGGTTALIYGGTNDQTYVNNGGLNTSSAVIVNKGGGRVILASPMAYTNASQDMTIAAGTLDLSGQPLTVNRTLTLGAQGRLKFNGTEQAKSKDVTVLPGAALELRVP